MPEPMPTTKPRTLTRLLATALGAFAFVLVSAGAAFAQMSAHPTVTPEENRSALGPLFGPVSFAVIFAVGAGLLIVLIVLLYMRYAPRFARDEESAKVVRADRVLPGREPPRRAVDLSQAMPVVVQPPQVPALVAAAASAAPAAAPAPAASPAQAAPAQATPALAAPASVDAAPAEAAPASEDAAPAEAAPASVDAAPSAAAPAEAPPPAPPAPTEHVEVTMDQEVYESTLAELLAQGTDGRIAEGKARRAGMIAAKKKAAGGG